MSRDVWVVIKKSTAKVVTMWVWLRKGFKEFYSRLKGQLSNFYYN